MKNPVLAVVVIVGLLFSGGCSPAEVESPTPVPSPSSSPTTVSASPTPTPEPSPSPEPSPEPTFTQELSPEQQEAYDLVEEHFLLRNELSKNPDGDWQPLIDTSTGEARERVLAMYQRMTTNGEQRVGDEIFFIWEVGDVREDDYSPFVSVTMCTDSGDSDIINAESGESVMVVEGPLILEWDVRLVRDHGGGWQVSQYRNQDIDSCDPRS